MGKTPSCVAICSCAFVCIQRQHQHDKLQMHMKHQLSAICFVSLKSHKRYGHYLGLKLIRAEMRYSLRKGVLAGTLILDPLLDGYMGGLMAHFKIGN